MAFKYALFDQGSGREFQSEPILNIAGLGSSDGKRPFRYFARPIEFAPRSTIRLQITEVSAFQGELHVALHGYKTLGTPGTPTAPGRARRRIQSMNGGIVSALPQLDVMRASYLCPNCGLPRDYEHFDESGFASRQRRSSPAVRWCWRASNCRHNTAGCSKISPSLPTCSGAISPRSRRPACNGSSQSTNGPLYPYVRLEHIVNPWGYGSFGVSIRLDENATVEFVVRNLGHPPPDRPETEINRVGGRIVGRFWYNPAYGDATPRACHFK